VKLDLIDNALPAAFVDDIDDSKPSSVDTLKHLSAEQSLWNELSLMNLVQELLNEADWLDIRGYTHPEIFFSDKERVEEAQSGMVLLDWDTGMDGVAALKETIRIRPDDGIFIITGFDVSSRVSEQVMESFKESAKRIAIFS
jgi:hypothetical protein